MALSLGRLRAFFATRNGKITAVGSGAVAVVGAGLYSRHRHAGDATPASSTATAPIPSYLQATGTSGANPDGSVGPVNDAGNGIDPGAFQDLLTELGQTNDNLQQVIDNQTPPATTTPAPTLPTSNPPPAPAPPPNVNPAPAAGKVVPPSVPWPGRVLRQGSSGADVSTWQAGANARINAGLVVDGKFGPLSAAAAKRIQAQAGIAQDGAVGRQTWNVTFYGTP